MIDYECLTWYFEVNYVYNYAQSNTDFINKYECKYI